MPGHDFCCAPGCSNSRDPFDKTLKFHRIPANPEVRRVWLSRINRADLREKDVTPNTRLCSEHFFQGEKTPEQPIPVYFLERTYPLARKGPRKRTVENYKDAPCSKRRKNAVSSCESAPDHDQTMEAVESLVRLQESFVCHGEDESAATTETSSSHDYLDHTLEAENTPVTTGQCARCYAKEQEIRFLKMRINILEEELKKKTSDSKQTSVEKMAGDDQQIHYYTGLKDYETFKHIFAFISPQLHKLRRTSGPTRRLAPEDELLLVLMRLVKGLQVKDLAYRFGIKSLGRVSTLFSEWMEFLATELSDFVHWPSREMVRKNLPESFAQSSRFAAVRAIMDCTEFRIQMPSSLSLNSMHFSNYKSDHTIKVLVCITPDGFISHVSEAYPGSISDNALTMESGLLDMCEPGDKLLADKGFTISKQELQPRGLELITPPFRDGDSQFSPAEVKETRDIARWRIKSEHAILRMKYCKYLKTRMAINSLSNVSHCLKVSAVLANCRMPLSKF